MTQRSRAILKTYYETGDFPTEAQFADSTDSDLNLVDDGNPFDLLEDKIYIPNTQPVISGGNLTLDMLSNRQAIFEPRLSVGTLSINEDFNLLTTNKTNALELTAVLSLTGTRIITFEDDVLISNASDIGTWAAPDLTLTAGTNYIIEFKFHRYSTNSEWILSVGDNAISVFPRVITDGNTVAWFDSQENITKDGSDLVSVWGDKSGEDNDLLQALNKPLWVENDGVLFDGIDNVMRTASFTFVQPEMVYLVLKQITWTANDKLMDGFSSNTGLITQFSAPPNLRANAGIDSSTNPNLIMDTYGIIRVLFNGASSKLQIDENAAITGDFGALNMGGITLGAKATLAQFANIQVKEVIFRKIADTAQDEQDIYDYLAAKYSI